MISVSMVVELLHRRESTPSEQASSFVTTRSIRMAVRPSSISCRGRASRLSRGVWIRFGGLLLLTNDGELAARLMHPRHRVDRVYEAQVQGVPDEADLRRLSRGVVIEGRRTAPATVRLRGARHTVRRPGRHGRGDSDRSSVRARVDSPATSRSRPRGRSRQVRKMCLAIGHPVLRLRRVRIGPITDPSLRTGACRPLTTREVAMLKHSAGLEPPR